MIIVIIGDLPRVFLIVTNRLLGHIIVIITMFVTIG